MNQGVELILKRMKSHPEEFEVPFIYNEHGYRHNSKWEWLIDRVVQRVEGSKNENAFGHLSFLTDEEIHLIYGKVSELQEGVFNRTVMHTIMNKPEEEYDTAQAFGTTQVVAGVPQTINVSQTWGAAVSSPLNIPSVMEAYNKQTVPAPSNTKVSYNAATDSYEVTYPNGFTQGFPKSELEDDPDYLRKLINSGVLKP